MRITQTYIKETQNHKHDTNQERDIHTKGESLLITHMQTQTRKRKLSQLHDAKNKQKQKTSINTHTKKDSKCLTKTDFLTSLFISWWKHKKS